MATIVTHPLPDIDTKISIKSKSTIIIISEVYMENRKKSYKKTSDGHYSNSSSTGYRY